LRHLGLEQALLEILDQHPQGQSEYQIFKLLQETPYSLFDKNCLSESLLLFQSHFILFHVLYQLRAQFLLNKQADMCINASLIRLLPYHSHAKGLEAENKLEKYYLDWNNFAQTKEQDVEFLLDTFWQKMAGKVVVNTDPELVEAAYLAFELPMDSELRLVKARYHKLQHIHHPDKGGCYQQAQQIEQHFQQLKIYLKNKYI